METVVEQEEKRLRPRRDPVAIERAIEEMDRLAKLSAGSEFIGEEEVIKWRRKRFSYLTQA